jgi:trans-aconitate 2-methyltransferase
MSWNPDQYLRFSQPRLRPAIDLLGRIALDQPGHVYDLGCGAGSVTALLRNRWPRANIVGVDNSAAMLEKAAKALPDVRWQQESLDHWQAGTPADLIYSNAALHWLPDHERLFPQLINSLKGGGVLAVQMPRNFGAPSHTMIADTVRAGPWRARLESLLGPSPVSEPSFYYRLLAPLSQTIDIWETEYLQVLTGEDPVKEWTKGTALIPYLERLSPSEQAQFEADYALRLRHAYPRHADGKTLFPFKRLFIVLRRH